MAYAVRTDLRTRFSTEELLQLTNRGQTVITTGMLDDGIDDADLSGYSAAEQAEILRAVAIIDAALADADAEIDPYLAPRYTLPLSSTPRVLTNHAADIARYRLHENVVPDAVRQRYQDAIRFLKDVAAGRASLGLDAAQEATPTTGGPSASAPDRIFTTDTLKGYTG